MGALAVRTLLAALALLALAAGPAAAAQRHAAPGGSGTACSAANPCAYTTAINSAAFGDEVILAPGDYGSAASPGTTSVDPLAQNLQIHGVRGEPRPRIFVNANFGIRLSPESTRADVEVRNYKPSPAAAVSINGGRADRVIAHAFGSGSDALGCQLVGASFAVSSVCTSASGMGARVAGAGGVAAIGTLRNVTAVGGFFGIQVLSNGASATGNVENSIARGPTFDVMVNRVTNAATLNIGRSNFRNTGTEAGGGGVVNQTAPNQKTVNPVFANAAALDFHQLPSSPTIDAGATNVSNGTLDFDEDPRALGSSTDIGADEFAPAASATTGAAEPTVNSVSVSGTFNPNGTAGSYRFEYGETATYGSSTPVQSFEAGTESVPGRAAVGGLEPSTTYHYRLVVTNRGGTAVGADRLFTTLPLPAGAVRPGACANTKRGTGTADVFQGTVGGDRLFGLAGNDVLAGLAGHDCLSGGAGNDRLGGDAGNDKVGGDSGRDRLGGGTGNDRLNGGSGNDRLDGGSGHDRLTGGTGRNVYLARSGNDSVFAANRVGETIDCGGGRDTAQADRRDRVRGCERVRRLRR